MGKKIAPPSVGGKVVDPSLWAKKAALRKERQRVEDLVRRYMRRASDAGVEGEYLWGYLGLLFTRPEAAQKASGDRRDRALRFHRRCLALLRLGHSPRDAERIAKALEKPDRGGRDHLANVNRVIGVVAGFFTEEQLRRAPVRQLVCDLAREVLPPGSTLPRTKNDARRVKDLLRGVPSNDLAVTFLVDATTPASASEFFEDPLPAWYRASRDQSWDAPEMALAALLPDQARPRA